MMANSEVKGNMSSKCTVFWRYKSISNDSYLRKMCTDIAPIYNASTN